MRVAEKRLLEFKKCEGKAISPVIDAELEAFLPDKSARRFEEFLLHLVTQANIA
jgi:hypothetical protein